MRDSRRAARSHRVPPRHSRDGGQAFDRLVTCEDEKRTAPETWTVSLEYLAGLDTGLNVRDILSFNPARIVVTDYPGPLPLPSESNGLQGTTP